MDDPKQRLWNIFCAMIRQVQKSITASEENVAGGDEKYQGGDEAEARGTDEQPLSDIPLLIRCGKIYIKRHSTKFSVKEMKEKSGIFYFFNKIKSKGKNKFLQNHRWESDFSVENLDLFFQR